ncbi:uncharacterized protein JCM15063_000261 [Sporobolomyces koalae]|uniref:uncharacterized protein n=1 Tax=Sporobolomyces koalae TaxID=500713 RepID=UPI00317016D7
MADDVGEYDFDVELYCIICDRRIDPNSTSRPTPLAASTASATAPLPSPRLADSDSVNTAPAPPNPTPSSSKSHHPPAAPKLRRTGSGNSNASSGGPKPPSAGATGALKRNKSSGKVHHAAGGAHRKNHSHANLHGLAAMTGQGKRIPVVAAGPAADKSAARQLERDKHKARLRDAEEDSDRADSTSTLYCSEECKRIDEARNQLQLAHLGRSDSSSSAPFPWSSPSSDGLSRSDDPYASMSRRRSSGVSSNASTTYAFSSAGERGLSPILSAAPTSNPSAYSESNGYPFPSLSSPPAGDSGGSLNYSMFAHASNSSLNSLPSQQSYPGPAPLLNFSSRRQARGAQSSGAYSYRPSLMERVHSTDSVESGASDRVMSRTARSLSIGTGGFSAGMYNRVKSIDGLAAMGRSDSESSDREGRQAPHHRPPSALSSLRSMTPISTEPPISSSARSRPSLASSRYSEPASLSPRAGDRPPTARIASDTQAIAHSRSRSRSRTRQSQRDGLPRRARSRPPPASNPLVAGSDPPGPIVGSLPTAFGREVSSGSPTMTTSLLRPVPVSPDSLLAARRSQSSASLALLSSSVSKSLDHRTGGFPLWSGLKRTDSTAGLSGLMAVGEITTPSVPASPLPPSTSSSTSTYIPASATYQHRTQPPRPRRPSSTHSHPHSSPSSATSSFAPSQSSVVTSSSSRRSTAASSDHWQQAVASSAGSNVGQSSGMHRTRSGSSSRPDRSLNANGSNSGTSSHRIKQGGLTMTPSSTNLTNIAPPSTATRTQPSLAPPVPSTAAPVQGNGNGTGSTGPASRTWSWTNLHVPTYQALDVNEFRARRDRAEKGSAEAEPRSDSAAGEAEVPTLRKERKRLFYFSDAGGDAE